MRSGLLLVLLTIFLSTSVGAATYACRDSSGKLYFTDNLGDVPDDCLQSMKRLNQPSTPVDNASPPAANEAPTPQLEITENSTGQNEAADIQTAQFQRRAADSAKKFTQGVSTMDEAKKRRRFGSKARFAETQKMVDEATTLIKEARQEKHQLLSELESQPIPAQPRADIEKLLESIH